MTFDIRADIIFEHSESARVEKTYPWMKLDASSRRGVITGLCLTCIMLGFDLSYAEP